MHKLMTFLLTMIGVITLAISFKTSSLTTPEYGVYNTSEFDGVDYTTTPTNVSETRAVDMSNYLPEGQALVKRQGITSVDSDISTTTEFGDWYYLNDGTRPYTYSDELQVVKLYKFKGLYVRFLNIKPVGSQDYMMMVESEYSRGGSHWDIKIPPKALNVSDNKYYYFALNAKNVSLYEYDNKLFFLIDSDIPVYGYLRYEIDYYPTSNGLGNGYPRIYPKLITNVNTLYNNSNTDIYTPTIATQIPYEDANGNNKFRNNITNIFEPFNIINNKVYIKSSFVANSENCSIAMFGDNPDYYEYMIKFDLSQIGDFGDIVSQETVFSTTPRSIAYPLEEEENVVYDVYYAMLPTFDSVSHIELWLILSKEYLNEICNGSVTIDFKFELTYGFWKNIDENTKSFYSPTLFNDFSKFTVYDDKLWFYGSDSHKNIDLHTDTAVNATDRYLDFTYIPDTSYQAFGSSATKIIGYGTLSNGNQLVLKEYSTSEPNMFVRTKNTTTSTNDYGMPEVKITYPITQSGVSLETKYYDTCIQFGDYMLINAPKGIYAVNIGTSTATQTYGLIEMSYFIRNDLDTDLTGSWFIVKEGKLYIRRKSKSGNYRIYVADLTRMALVEGHYQFEWWVLDDMNFDKAEIIDDEIIFMNEYGTYKFYDGYMNKYIHKTTATNTFDLSDGSNPQTEGVVSTYINGYVSYIHNYNKMLLSRGFNIYPTNLENFDYDNFKKNFKLTYNDVVFAGIVYIEDGKLYEVTTGSRERTKKIVNGEPVEIDENSYLSYIFTHFYKGLVLYEQRSLTNANATYANVSQNAIVGQLYSSLDNMLEFIEGVYYVYVDNNYQATNDKPTLDIGVDKLYYMKLNQAETEYNIYDYDHCVKDANIWYYINDGIYEEIGNATGTNEVVFNAFSVKLKFNGYEVSIDDNDLGLIMEYYDFFSGALSNKSNVKLTLEYQEPVKSYWYSKHNCLGDVSTLKTMTNMYFVPEVRHGGETYVGYRTCKRENQYFTNAKGGELDFNDINFDDFTFADRPFGKTYSSKKKVKNFSFIQLKIYSNEGYDSSASMLSFKYRYSKNNKGVK